MKYEFFSTSRHPEEVVCAFPMIRRIMSALNMRRAILHLTLHNNKTVQVMSKRYRGFKLHPPHKDFMRFGRVHEPIFVLDDTVYINTWHRQARGVFGELTLESIAQMCNYHFKLMELPLEEKIQNFIPHLPRKTLNLNYKLPQHSSLYPSVFVTSQAALFLDGKMQWPHLFSACSRGFFAIPDSISLNPANVWRYDSKGLDKVMLGELVNKFDIVITTAQETAMFDIKAGPKVIYVIDDGSTYRNFEIGPFVRKTFCWENGHTFLIDQLRQGIR
jgi:hypothetical protein